MKKLEPQFKSRVTIRRLPPSIDHDALVASLQAYSSQISHLTLVPGKARTFPNEPKLSVAYCHFSSAEALIAFSRAFDGHLYLQDGKAYKAVVEYATLQWKPSPSPVDPLEGTIEQDTDYQQFLHRLEHPELYEADAGSSDPKASERAAGSSPVTTPTITPLLAFIAKKKLEKKAKLAKKSKQAADKKKAVPPPVPIVTRILTSQTSESSPSGPSRKPRPGGTRTTASSSSSSLSVSSPLSSLPSPPLSTSSPTLLQSRPRSLSNTKSAAHVERPSGTHPEEDVVARAQRLASEAKRLQIPAGSTGKKKLPVSKSKHASQSAHASASHRHATAHSNPSSASLGGASSSSSSLSSLPSPTSPLAESSRSPNPVASLDVVARAQALAQQAKLSKKKPLPKLDVQ